MAAAPITQPLPEPQVQIVAAPRADSTWARLVRQPLFLLGAAILLGLFLIALLAPLITPGDAGKIYANGVDALGVPHAPGGGFALGADTLGRDVWTRVAYGARLSLTVALCAMVTSTLIGTTVGLVGGFFGGWVDAALTRLTEVVASLPTILLAITLAVVLPDRMPGFFLFAPLKINPDLTNFKLLLAIGLVTWTGIARAVRGQTLALREREFIEAARALGLSNGAILWRHLLPNVVPTVVVLATLATAQNILLEAGLSYLALGKPEQASWGALIADGQAYLLSAPWIVLAPGAAIVAAVTAFNLIGNALGEVWETRR